MGFHAFVLRSHVAPVQRQHSWSGSMRWPGQIAATGGAGTANRPLQDAELIAVGV